MESDKSKQFDEHKSQLERLMHDILRQLQIHTKLLSEIQMSGQVDTCLLEKIGHIVCLTANEDHRQTELHTAIHEAIDSFLEIYRSAHPEQALQQHRVEKLRAELLKCCPPDIKTDLICHFEPCKPHDGITTGDGYSMKSKGFVHRVQVNERPHPAWNIRLRTPHEEDEELPVVPQGPIVGQIIPSKPTPQVLDFRSGSGSFGSEGQEPVTFRTFSTTQVSGGWPPDMSGAKTGDVVLMSGNLWLKLSIDGGKTFKDLDFTKLFAADKTYGGWAGDQVIHYVPSIDCFILYVQSYKFKGEGINKNKNVIKIAIASPEDLKKFGGGREAWARQWDFTSDTFGLGNSWMDFPDMTYGDKFLYVNTNVFDALQGKLFFELPLVNLKEGSGFSFQYAFLNERMSFSSPTQNIGDENYWAAHVNNSTMRIYSSKGSDTNYFWRERKLKYNWPRKDDNDIISAAPDFSDWLSEDHRIIGATRVNNQLWFAWTANNGDGGSGGFKFPHPHIQVAKFDLSNDYGIIDQVQIWNPNHAFAYPCLMTNSDNEVGISLAWGGGGKYPASHAVGILGDFIVWFGEASEMTSVRPKQDSDGNIVKNPDGSPVMISRWGDYVHVRLAQPDTRFFSAFGYAVLKDPTTLAEKFDYLYVEFGRDKLSPPPIR